MHVWSRGGKGHEQTDKRTAARNNALDAQLNKDNQQMMTNIVVYIRSANISEYEQELVRRDITHMLLDAQAEGRTAAEVLGEDAQASAKR